MKICRYHMDSASLKLLLLASALLILEGVSTQELYEDEPLLEQYSPLLGENFLTYPMLEEYGIPTVEEFPDEDEDDEDYENEEKDSLKNEKSDKKDSITYADNEHAQKTHSTSNSKSDAREKRHLPLQDDPVEIAREKLQRAIKAAQALSGIEKELGLDPSTIENKTAKLETDLQSEEKNFKKLADEAQDPSKKANFVKVEKDADDDVKKAENILKLIVKLEAAKYLAKERAQEDLEKAEKRKMASMPQSILGRPLSYQPQAAGYLGGIQQPYHPVWQSYTASYQPQMFQGTSTGVASTPNNVLSPDSLTVSSKTAPAYQSTYQDNAEIQSINSIKETEAAASVLPSQTSSQQKVEAIEPDSTKITSYSSEEGNTNNKNLELNDLPSSSAPSEPAAIQPPETPMAQSSAPALASNELLGPQLQGKPQETNERTASPQLPSSISQATEPAKLAVPAQNVAPVQPVTPQTHSVESPFGQSKSLMSQTAPLTASYNPNVPSPNTGPLSRYFVSASNSPELFAPQSFYQPLPQSPPQAFAPPTPLKKLNVKPGTLPATPAGESLSSSSSLNDRPQTSLTTSFANLESPRPAAYANQQAELPVAYPSGSSFYSRNSQAFPSSNLQYSWNQPSYFPAPAPYQAPVTPLIAEAYRKLHDTEHASLAMSKIEEAIGLSPSSVRHIIDDVEKQSKQEEAQYEDEMSKEKAEINKEKELLQTNEATEPEEAKKKIKEEESKLRNDIQKENVAKLEVDKIKKIEKILTIIEAAKYSAMQRAKKRINKLKTTDKGTDSEEIRKRDLEDLEKDIKKRRRNEINIWLKGSRNHIDTSHFLRNHIGRLRKQAEENSRWSSGDKQFSEHSHYGNLGESAVDDVTKEGKLPKLRFFKTLVSNKRLESGNKFAVEKRTDIPETPEKSANSLILAKLVQKMDKIFKIQEDILKYLQAEHEIHDLQKKPKGKRWRRSLHHSKHHRRLTRRPRRKRKEN